MVKDWVLVCPNCDRESAVDMGEDYSFTCPYCDTVYGSEDGFAYNRNEVENYRRSYMGAKIAGMIPEKEFEGDREQRETERHEW